MSPVEHNPIIRSFARIYPRRKELNLTETLNIIMEEICGQGVEVTEEMLETAKTALEGKRGKE